MAIQQEAKSNATASTGKEDKQPLSLAEALTLAQSSMADMETAITRIHSEVFREFREISRAITKTKSEISALQANDIRSERIPEAGRELIAVVDATEDATNCIMECAETIMTADPSNPATYHNVVNENVMAIFEACSFQDLTGQRISRVVETLEHIENVSASSPNALASQIKIRTFQSIVKSKIARSARRISSSMVRKTRAKALRRTRSTICWTPRVFPGKVGTGFPSGNTKKIKKLECSSDATKSENTPEHSYFYIA